LKARLNAKDQSPAGMKAMAALHAFVHQCGLEQSLLELVKLRASQINGCAHCIDMHAKALRALGESESRVYLLNAWRDSPQYSARERAALAWTEALTLVAKGHVPDELYEAAQHEFGDQDLVSLTLAIVAINGANRINIAFRTVPNP
jgi:AhpD family alkylhydroperoxidase